MEAALHWRIISLVSLIGTCFATISRAENNTTNIISSGATNAGASYVVGQSGQFNYLEIRSGAGLTNGTGYIGYTISGANNNAVVTGTGSRWINTNDLYIGFTGPGNHLTITNGGQVLCHADGFVGGFSDSGSDNIALVTGSGSFWSNDGDLYVGYLSDGNQLTLTNGGRVTNQFSYLGNGGSSNNKVF